MTLSNKNDNNDNNNYFNNTKSDTLLFERCSQSSVLTNQCNHGRPAEFFQRGGANLWGGAKKICEGGSHIFFRQVRKYAYRGAGSFIARRVLF